MRYLIYLRPNLPAPYNGLEDKMFNDTCPQDTCPQ
jgi:hypothetical protein